MILGRDKLLKIVEGSAVQVVATPGASWVRLVHPVLARNLFDEEIVACGGSTTRYWSPRGFYVRLNDAVDDAEGNEIIGQGVQVFVDPSGSVELIAKAEGGKLPYGRRSSGKDAATAAGLIVGTAVFVGAGLG